jgi:GAF domain-containing protein
MLGVLTLLSQTKERWSDPAEQTLATDFARQAALAIERARL